MMKIVKSLSIIMAVVAVVAGGTYAWLNDEEVISGTTFATASMDLQIDSNIIGDDNYIWEDSFVSPFKFVNLMPGNWNEQIIDIRDTSGEDNIAKIKFVAGGSDALIDNIYVKVSYDGNHDKYFDDVTEGYLSVWNDGNYRTMGAITGASDDYNSNNKKGKIASVKIKWSIPGSVGNEIQGKSMTLNTYFGLDQVQKEKEVEPELK